MYDPQSKLAAQSLSAGYSADAIIKDLDLELPGGSITAVVGANGAGKSSLLKALARKIRASSGAGLLDGVSITSLTKAQVEGSFGFLGTSPATKNNETGFDLVARSAMLANQISRVSRLLWLNHVSAIGYSFQQKIKIKTAALARGGRGHQQVLSLKHV